MNQFHPYFFLQKRKEQKFTTIKERERAGERGEERERGERVRERKLNFLPSVVVFFIVRKKKKNFKIKFNVSKLVNFLK